MVGGSLVGSATVILNTIESFYMSTIPTQVLNVILSNAHMDVQLFQTPYSTQCFMECNNYSYRNTLYLIDEHSDFLTIQKSRGQYLTPES